MQLRIPGPTPLPPDVLASQSKQMINHRGPEFGEIIARVTSELKHFFQTENDLLILTGSGTGAMEAAVVNMLSPGERAMAISIGNFGDRFTQLASKFGVDVVKVEFPPSQAVDPDDIARRLDADPAITTVIVTHNETSTGVTNPLDAIARVVKEREKLLIVDGVSSVGSIDLKTDAWGCDVVLSGSQKGWMAPPGLAFASVSPLAWERHAKAQLPRFYWDFTAAKRYLEHGETPWTPSITTFYALDVSLRAMRAEGRDEIFARHARVAQRCRDGVVAKGLRLYADPQHASNTVTAFYTPEGVDSRIIARELEDEYDTVLAIGQGATTTTTMRVGHLGWVDENDIDQVIQSLGEVLSRVPAQLNRLGRSRLPILVVDPIAQDGIDALKRHTTVDVRLGLTQDQLIEIIGGYDGLVVRSETKVTAAIIAAGTRLQVIGRAGVGVDNIDVEAATARGIVVVNSPSGNTIAVAEHTLGLIIAAARNITAAATALHDGRWERAKFMGVEIRGKTLGILGLGRIGTEVARRAQSFEMRILGHDPYVSEEHASRMGARLADMQTLLAESDFLTIHTPATVQTEGLIGSKELATMKPTAWIVNCARGGIVDEADLLVALDAGQIAGAALDVYAKEPAGDNPLVRHPKVVATPHLAASTQEAQVNVAVEVADQMVAVLEGRPAPFAVNAPPISAESARVLAPFSRLAQTLGNLATQLTEGQLRGVEITYSGEIAEHDTTALKASVIRGLLETVSEEPVTFVNAAIVARNRGLRITELKSSAPENYTNLVTVRVQTERGESLVGGTILNGTPHIVRIDEYWVSVESTGGHVLLTRHTDRPGIIGAVGRILGEADINISQMQVGRENERGPALMLVFVDEAIPTETLRKIQSTADLQYAKLVRI